MYFGTIKLTTIVVKMKKNCDSRDFLKPDSSALDRLDRKLFPKVKELGELLKIKIYSTI